MNFLKFNYIAKKNKYIPLFVILRNHTWTLLLSVLNSPVSLIFLRVEILSYENSLKLFVIFYKKKKLSGKVHLYKILEILKQVYKKKSKTGINVKA